MALNGASRRFPTSHQHSYLHSEKATDFRATGAGELFATGNQGEALAPPLCS